MSTHAQTGAPVLSRPQEEGDAWSFIDRLAVAAYLGRGANFDKAIARFSAAYADQNELDHQRLGDAVSAGDVAVESGV